MHAVWRAIGPRRIERDAIELRRGARKQDWLGVIAIDGGAKIAESKCGAGRQCDDQRIERTIANVGQAIADEDMQRRRIGRLRANLDFARSQMIPSAERHGATREAGRRTHSEQKIKQTARAAQVCR